MKTIDEIKSRSETEHFAHALLDKMICLYNEDYEEIFDSDLDGAIDNAVVGHASEHSHSEYLYVESEHYPAVREVAKEIIVALDRRSGLDELKSI
jgi:hypothetical protein